jgi:hypothetical protein
LQKITDIFLPDSGTRLIIDCQNIAFASWNWQRAQTVGFARVDTAQS